MKIVPIPTPNLKDVPQSLRRLADQINAGEVPAVEQAIVVAVSPEGLIDLYGYGAIDPSVQTLVGILHLAILKAALELQRGTDG